MRPMLIHRVEVEILQVDAVATGANWDPDFREPTRANAVTYKAPIVIMAQPRFDRHERENMTPGGDAPVTSGHVIAYPEDAAKVGKGDKIKRIAGHTFTSPLDVKAVEPTAFYPGDAMLMKIVFASEAKY